MENKFLLARPRKWKNKESGKFFKVVPWFQPMNDESRFNFKGLIKDCMPELKDDILKDFECYTGLVMQLGWLLENENRCWLGLIGIEMKDHFEEVGYWTEEVKNESSDLDL